MADFKAMMAAKNKKHSPVDDIRKVEENRDAIEKVEEIREGLNEVDKIRDTTPISTPEPLKNSTDAPAESNAESSAESSKSVENPGVDLATETEKVEKIREEKDSKKPNTTISSGKTKKSTTTKSKKVDKNRDKESLSEDASLNLSTFKETPTKQQAEPTEQEPVPEPEAIKKTNMSLSKTSVNYVRMNSKRQRISQMEYFKNIVLELKEKEETSKTLSYDNFELRKRHIIDSTPLNIILPESLLDWLRDEAADNCVSVSQFIDEFIQEKIHKEHNVDK